MDRYFFILTTIDLFVLGFMCFLTKLSESLNKKQKRGFFLAYALIAAISVLEVITIVVDGTPPGYRWLNILSNYLGFGLTPAVALCLVYVLDKKTIIRRGFKVAVCCEGGYLLFLAATLPYGPVFSVSAENLYARGGYFFIYVIMYYASMLYLMVATVRTAAVWGNLISFCIYGHYRQGVSESQQTSDLSTYSFRDGGNDHSGCSSRTSCYLVMCYVAIGIVFYLLQRDVEPAGRADRTFEPEQLPEPHH